MRDFDLEGADLVLPFFSRDTWNGRSRRAAFFVLVLAVGTAVLGCGREEQMSSELTPEERRAVADTVSALSEEMVRTFEELEPEPFFDHYSTDFYKYLQGARLSRSDWEERVRKQMAALESVTEEIVHREVEVLGSNAAAVTHQVVVQAVDTAGEHGQATFAATYIYRHRGQGWSIIAAHQSVAASTADS